MKKLLIFLSVYAFVFGCDKHNDDYKNNIPNGSHSYPPKEEPTPTYSLDELRAFYDEEADLKVCDYFIRGYRTVTSVNVIHREEPPKETYHISIEMNGPTIKGGIYKNDPCDDGFKELAEANGEVFGENDAITHYCAEKTIMSLNNVKFYLYAIHDYDERHPAGSLLNDICGYWYGKRFRRPSIGQWHITSLSYYRNKLDEFNASEETLIETTWSVIDVEYPASAGTYSFRLIAKSGDEILCNKIIENVELPARK